MTSPVSPYILAAAQRAALPIWVKVFSGTFWIDTKPPLWDDPDLQHMGICTMHPAEATAAYLALARAMDPTL